MTISVIGTVDLSAYAENEAENFSTYKFSYLSDQEAKAFIGFLLGKNDLDEQLWQTDIFNYLTGRLKNDFQKECEA